MTTTAPPLPEGLTERPLTMADARAVYEVMAAAELDDIGMIEIEEADIVGDWGRPSFDVSAQTIGVFDAPATSGSSATPRSRAATAATRPSTRRTAAAASAPGWPAGCRTPRAAAAPRSSGCRCPRGRPATGCWRRSATTCATPAGCSSCPQAPRSCAATLPEGYAVREARADEWPAAHDVVEDAFLEWSVREREPYDDFEASIMGRPGFEPWNLRVVIDADGDVVGVAYVVIAETDDGRDPEAYISRLAVRRDQRRRGLAQALMVDSFEVAREHGALVSGLPTDSRTGALDLYTKVGMEVTSVWVSRAIHLV